MALKKKTVVMNGNIWGKYCISLKSYITLLCIRFYLWCLRWIRRSLRALGYCKYALTIFPFWALFLTITKLWGTHKFGAYTWGNLLWDMKSSIFSSIILTTATSFIAQYTKKKTAYIAQHELYIHAMAKMSRLFKDINMLLYNDDSKDLVPHWPFYINYMGDSFHKELMKRPSPTGINTNAIYSVLCSIDDLKTELRDLREHIMCGKFDQCNYMNSMHLISLLLTSFSKLEQVLATGKTKTHFGMSLFAIYRYCYELLEELRRPWRKDLSIKIKALKIIYNEDTTIADTFYNSALLNVVDYKEYEELLSFIDQIKNQAKQGTLKHTIET